MRDTDSKLRMLWVDLRIRRGEVQIPAPFIERCELKLIGKMGQAGRISAFAPELLCMDFDYPDLPGLQLLQKTKRLHPGIPLIMVTEAHSEALAVWAFRNGVRDFLVRPVSGSEAERVIDSLIELGKRKPERREYIYSDAVQVPDEVNFKSVKPSADRIEEAKSYIQKNLGRKIQERVIAEHCNMSPFRFSRAFRKSTGITFQEYVIRARIKESCRLLENPAVSISDVAYAVGFNDSSYFARLFRRYTGQSPSEYRQPAVAPEDEGAIQFLRLSLADNLHEKERSN